MTDTEVRWAPRVERSKIRRLYESEARGLHDAELLEDVGVALYARCESILRLTEAYRGRVECPRCHRIVQVAVEGRHHGETIIACECGWQMTWRAYKRTTRWFDKRDDRLEAGNAEHVFRRYIQQYPLARTFSGRMLLVDWLLHEFHVARRSGTDNGLVAPMIIEGTTVQVTVFLDELAGLRPEEAAEAWRQRFASSGSGKYLGRQLESASALVSEGQRNVLRRLATRSRDGD
jgi:hypothetical protein